MLGLYPGEFGLGGNLTGSGLIRFCLSSLSNTLDNGWLKLENFLFVVTRFTSAVLVLVFELKGQL